MGTAPRASLTYGAHVTINGDSSTNPPDWQPGRRRHARNTTDEQQHVSSPVRQTGRHRAVSDSDEQQPTHREIAQQPAFAEPPQQPTSPEPPQQLNTLLSHSPELPLAPLGSSDIEPPTEVLPAIRVPLLSHEQPLSTAAAEQRSSPTRPGTELERRSSSDLDQRSSATQAAAVQTTRTVPQNSAATMQEEWAREATIRKLHRYHRVLEWPFLIGLSLLVAFILRGIVLQSFYIPSGSMENTLVEHDRVVVNKLSYRLHDIHRTDVVVFRRPPNLRLKEDHIIKRVIGLPGETVQGRDRHVLVNGKPLKEPYVRGTCQGTADFAPVKVPSGHVFVMGDNRCNSTDSRVFGPINQKLIVGGAFGVMWPLTHIGGL